MWRLPEENVVQARNPRAWEAKGEREVQCPLICIVRLCQIPQQVIKKPGLFLNSGWGKKKNMRKKANIWDMNKKTRIMLNLEINKEFV